MCRKKQILVVDDSSINRTILRKILSSTYLVLEAENGKVALDILLSKKDSISAVLLDIVMPVLSGYEFLSYVRSLKVFSALPIVVMTTREDAKTEIRALELGATDFVPKPYQPAVLKQRIANILLLSEASSLRDTVERDPLTGLYNKTAFYTQASELMQAGGDYEIICMDVEHFKLINDLFGAPRGDQLLQFIGKAIQDCLIDSQAVCGRLDADRFAVCLPATDTLREKKLIAIASERLRKYPLRMNVDLKLGIYPVDDPLVPVNVMCDRASLAIESIKGKFQEFYARYDDSHRDLLLEEQEIINSMHKALTKHQFVLFFQPKYDLTELTIIGAEALVRWKHPRMGMLTPNRFIPIFERNGFISSMDEYVWNAACRCLRDWMDAGKPVVPISVNVSRGDIYNPNLCATLKKIIQRYAIPAELLRLEITETAYAETPEELIRTIHELRQAGFIIEMDDFGSGYSSLNSLKDIPVDILKMDLRFLEGTDESGRGASILASVVRMAKWLKIPVIAEGVERKEQIEFLRSIGCNSAQGYYFARPMPKRNFEKLLVHSPRIEVPCHETLSVANIEELWKTSSEFNVLFNNLIGAVAICELTGNNLEVLRANDAYFSLTGLSPESFFQTGKSVLEGVLPEDRELILNHFRNSISAQDKTAFKYRRQRLGGQKIVFLECQVRCLAHDKNRALFYVLCADISEKIALEARIEAQALTAERQKQLYTQLLDTIPCGLALLTQEENPRFLSINKSALDLLGYSEKLFWSKERYLFDFVVDNDKEAFLQRLNQWTKEDKLELDYRLCRIDKTPLQVREHFQQAIDPDGEHIYQCVLTAMQQDT